MKLCALLLALSLGYASLSSKPAIELPGYFSCRASLLTPDENAALACYAPTQRGCQQGKVVLAYERRLGPPSAKQPFTVVDTVQLTVRYQKTSLAIANCTAGADRPHQYFVLSKYDALGQKYLRNVLRVWGVNAQGRLVEVPVKTIRCLNDDFGA